MKTLQQLSFLFATAILFTACSTAYKPYAYDDVYYNPNNDPIKQMEKDPSNELNKTDNITYDNSYPNRYTEGGNDPNYPQGVYQNRYTETEAAENSGSSASNNNQTVIINNNTNGDTEYYDEEYAETVRRLNTPVQSFNSYDPYMRSRIAYTNDPFFYGPSLYNNFAFYDPFFPSTGLGIGWNSWSGWNVGIGIGFGYSSWACPSPFWNPWRPVWGYNPWGPNWGWGWGASWGAGWGFGWGYDPYLAGYNQGFNNGYFFGDHHAGQSGRTYISSPRGSSGSRAFTEPRRTDQRPAATNYRTSNENGNSRVARPATTSPNAQPSATEERRMRTPGRYATDKTPETYSRPSRPSSPANNGAVTNTPGSTNLQPSNEIDNRTRRSLNNSPSNRTREIQSRPYNNDNYNSQRPVNSRRSRDIQRQQNYQSSPSMNRSRPSYNSTPTYSPSRSMGGSSSPSRSTPRGRRR